MRRVNWYTDLISCCVLENVEFNGSRVLQVEEGASGAKREVNVVYNFN